MRSSIQGRLWLLLSMVLVMVASYLLSGELGLKRLAETERAYAGEPATELLVEPGGLNTGTEVWSDAPAINAKGLLAMEANAGSLSSARTSSPDKNNVSMKGAMAALDNKVFVPYLVRNYQAPATEDFSSGSGAWPASDGDISLRTYLDGEYRILLKQANFIARAGPGLVAADLRVEVDARAAAHLDGGYGLYIAQTDPGYYYYSVYRGAGILLQRYDRPAAKWNALMFQASHPAVRGGGSTNRLAVERRGSTMTMYVNEQQVGQVVDGTYGQGTVGVGASSFQPNFDARFDNFVLIFTPEAP